MTHDEIDAVWACRHHQLMQIKGEVSKQRIENEFERSKLRRVLEDRMKQLQVSKKHHSQNGNLALYRNEIQSSFASDKIDLPPIVLTRQAQLCRSIHIMTAVDNDLLLVKKHCRDLIKLLETIARQLAEETADVEMRFVNEIVKLKCEIGEMKRKFDHVVRGGRAAKQNA